MTEMQGMVTFFMGLISLGLVIEAAKAFLWAVIVASILRRYGYVPTKRKKKR